MSWLTVYRSEKSTIVVPKSQVDTLLAHINTIEPSRFILERENAEGCLPFLDVLLHHNNDGTLFTSVYRKPTHTDKYLNFDSHHPLMHKVAVVRTLVSRANALCSTSRRSLTTSLVHWQRTNILKEFYNDFLSPNRRWFQRHSTKHLSHCLMSEVFLKQ